MRPQTTDQHHQWMQRALELARKAAGKTAPNPMVGAVLVKNGKVVGEGFHKKAGTPHAEIHALKQAGAKARGATLYVTLEPCCHFGRTGPCTEALLAAGVSHVFIGSRDPNPLVAGKGIKKLRTAGLKVELGVEGKACDALICAYRQRTLRGKPWVQGKLACSLDGRIATKTFASKWISNAAARKFAHQLRERADAIVIGSNTVRCDNPKLTVRLGKKEIFKPVVVVDSKLSLALSFQLFRRKPDQAGVILATTNASLLSHRHAWEKLGFTLWVLPQGADGFVDLPALLHKMGELGWNEILVEGGSTLMTAFLRARLVDSLAVAIAPIFIGSDGQALVRELGVEKITDALHLSDVSIQALGDNVLVQGRVRK